MEPATARSSRKAWDVAPALPAGAFLVFLACVVGCAGPPPEAGEKEAVAALGKLGVRLTWDDGGESVVGATYPKGEYSPEDLAWLSRLPGLQSLGFHFATCKPGAFRQVGKCVGLRFLELKAHKLSDEELRALESLPLLATVSISGDPNEHKAPYIRAGGLESLSRLPSLESLLFTDCVVEVEGLRHLAAAPRLRGLGFATVRLTGEAMKEIGRLTGLRELAVTHAQIGDAGLAHLRGLGALDEDPHRGEQGRHGRRPGAPRGPAPPQEGLGDGGVRDHRRRAGGLQEEAPRCNPESLMPPSTEPCPGGPLASTAGGGRQVEFKR